MTRTIVRTLLTTLAFVLLFAGSSNLNRTTANEFEVVAGGKCQDYCGCPGGALLCCIITLPDGTEIQCGMSRIQN
ncbi:MAG TPA: hypothetical protein VJM12_14415 [Pyrinomonadaceae bacterium]|nr:hypothetical protein [Pyrinomonadaceae bacterium]